jgi:hypothetical protein
VSCRLTLVNGNTVELSETTPLPSKPEIARIEVCLGPDSTDMAKELGTPRFRPITRCARHLVQLLALAFATMGWPEKTDTLKKFYPTSDLVTGP